jgi:RNA polymerase sigma-70 factor (ECF subfamily)
MKNGKIGDGGRSKGVHCGVLTIGEATWERGPVVTERAFAVAVREHEPTLAAIARRLCGNAADADDLLHDTYERALRAWERYADQGNLRGWLVAILNNLFVDRCRRAKRARMESIDPIVDIPAPEPAAPPVWTRVSNEQVAAALNELGTEFRRVYELHAAGKSYDEIAAELNIAKATVGTRLVRARKKLKDRLTAELGVEP